MTDGEVSQSAKTPADFLKSIKGKPVVVKLNSGVDYRGTLVHHSSLFFTMNVGEQTLLDGFLVIHDLLICAGILACLDGYMNIAMESTEASA